jgi:tetratricopeptide (TPR) repeat protein
MRVLSGVLSALTTFACVTPPTTKPVEPSAPGPGSTVSSGDARWTPGPGADAALAALWKVDPFTLPAAELAKASGGPVARFAEVEPLLSELHVRYDEKGRGTQRIHTVYRILREDEDVMVQRVGWAAWHEKKPVIRTRVVGPDGEERLLDPATIVEGSRISSSDMLTDARVLRAPLPGAKVGSVVESLVIIEDNEPSFGPAASGRFETWQYALRRARLVLEHPASLPLVATVIGEGTLEPGTRDGLKRLSLDLTPSPFPLFTLARLDVPVKLPRVEWSTGTSWQAVSSGYAPWVDGALAQPIDISTLKPRVASKTARTEKVQETLAWLRDRARYMALHLGAGALKPTSPAEVLKRGYGDCKDLSVSMVSALSQLGIQAHVALVQAGGVPTNEKVPGLSGFDHAIVYVPATKDEPAFWLDATAEGFPVGTLPNALLDRKALVIAPGTQGLTALPTRAAITSRVKEDIVIRQAEFGESSATITRAFEGPIAGWMRSRFAKADARELEEALRPSNRQLVGDDSLVVKFENAEPSLSSPRFVGTAQRLSSVDTGGLTATVALAGPVVGSFADDDWLGRDGARKEENPEAEAQRAKDILDATGLTEAQLDARPVKLSERLVLERTLRVVPAPGFVAGPLPPSRTLEFGPARWSESFSTAKDGAIEVQYRFDSGGVDFEGAALAEFRQSFWKWDKESWPRLNLLLEADALFQQSKPGEAMAAWRAALVANPKKGVLRARYAQALSNLGFDELARPEIDRALKDTPKHPLVLMIEGDIRRRGTNGIIYGKGFDRAGAIKAMRGAIAELPRHSWPRFRLAELLERDVDGELVWTKTPELLEALTLYEQLADENLADALTPLYDAQLRLGLFREVLARKQKERQSPEADLFGRVASFMVDGPQLCVQYLRGIEEPQQRASEAASMLGVISLQRDPAKLDAAAAAFEPTMPGGAGAILKSIFSGIKPSTISKDLSSPEAAMRSLLSQMAPSPSTLGKQKVAQSLGTKVLADEVDKLGLQALAPLASGALAIDAMLTRGKCVADTLGASSRVTCTVPLGKPLVTTAWFVKEGATWKLESLGMLSTLADRAFKAAAARDGEQATKWLNWTSERVDQLGIPARMVELRLFRSFWPPQATPTPQELSFAAAQARLFGFVDEAVANEIAKAFEMARPSLTGAKKRLTDQVLASVYLRAQQAKKSAEILKPLAEAEGEDALFQQLAGAMMRAGQLKEARALTTKALERTPTDATWTTLAASVAEREGRYADARATYEAVYARTNDEDLINNLLWARYMTGLHDEESEKMANTLSAKKTASTSELHTAAAVLVARGKVPAAAQLAQRIALRSPPGTPDDPRLQLKAELLGTLGFVAEAKTTWNQLALKDGLSDMARLKEKGLKALDGKK